MNESSPEPANRGEDAKATALSSSKSAVYLEAARPELSSLHFGFLSIGLLMSLFLSILDTSIVATSLFEIGAELNTLRSVNWVALAYSLTYLGFAVLLAQISDIVGRRKTFAFSYIVFIASSIGCGFARNLTQLIACRAIQGFGGSGLYSLSMIILLEVSPLKLGRYIGGMVGIIVTLSTVLGPVLGGVLTHYASWSWVFWINGPIGVVSLLLFYVLWPKPQALPDIERRSWKSLDYVGSILLVAGSVLVVFPFQDAGSSPDQWSKAIFIGPLVVGAVSWLGLFVWSIFVDRSREDTVDVVLPMRLMRHPVYMGAALNTLCLGFPYMLIIYAFPLRLRVVDGKDAFTAGVMLLPMLGPSALGSMIAGMVNGKKSRIFEMLFAGGCLTVLGCALLSTISSTYDAEAKTLGFLVFVGLGFGISVSTSTMVATTHCSARDHALAQGIIAQVRVLGGSLGIAASSAIVGYRLQKQVGSTQINYNPGAKSNNAVMIQDHQIAIRQAYSDAFNECMRVCAFIGGAAALVAFAAYNQKPRGPSEQHVKEESSRDRAAQPSQAPAI